MLGLLGIQVSESFIKWAGYSLLVIAVVSASFFAYRHFENDRNALIAQAQQSATASVETKVEAASDAMLKAQEAEMQRQVDAKNVQDAKDQNDWDATLAQVNALPLDATPDPASPAPAAAAASKAPKSKPHAQPVAIDPVASVRSLDARLNRMLESASNI